MRSEIRRIGDSYFVLFKEAHVTLEFSRIVEHRDTITAEVSIVHEQYGGSRWYRINLASASGRTAVIKILEGELSDIPWRQVLDTACQAVVKALRTPEPSAPMAPTPTSPGRWLVEPWIPLHETTVLFADGGTGKSLLALAIAVAGLQGHALGPWRVGDLSSVMYLDWESSIETHNERLHGLTAHLEPLVGHAIHHRRLTRPLTDSMDLVRADLDRHRVDFMIADSLGPACGPEPEGGDAAIRTMMALASLPVTRLAVAHLSKLGAEAKRSRPYGSVYIQNLARSVIEARRPEDEDEDGGNTMTLSLFHRKTNFGPRSKPVGIQFHFNGNGEIDVNRHQPDMTHASTTAQILDALRQGPKSATEVANLIERKANVARAYLSRLEKSNKVIQLVADSGGRGKKGLWGLIDEKRNTPPF